MFPVGYNPRCFSWCDTISYLGLVSLVTTKSLAVVEVAVHTGIGLVHHVGLVRASSVGSWAGGLAIRSKGAAGAAQTAVCAGGGVAAEGASLLAQVALTTQVTLTGAESRRCVRAGVGTGGAGV